MTQGNLQDYSFIILCKSNCRHILRESTKSCPKLREYGIELSQFFTILTHVRTSYTIRNPYNLV